MAETNGFHPTANLPLHTFAALAERAALSQRLGLTFNGKRNLHETLGYRTGLLYRDFKAQYIRGGIAKRIVRAYPDVTWRQPPVITEEGQAAQTETPFTTSWQQLAKRLQVFATLKRLDVLANLGQYAVLLIGLRGQIDLATPARPVRSQEDILYLTPYSEEWATVERLEGNPGLPTFGKPLYYRINFGRNQTERTKAALPIGTGLVHASRIIHVAEDILDDEVYGIPRLEPLYNYLDDLLKVVGGSAEMFWLDAKRRLVFSLRDDYTSSPEMEATITEEVEEFMHELRNFVRVQGVDVKALDGQVSSPKEHFEVLKSLIAATVKIPQRILFGSERGELASSQDLHEFLASATERQEQYAGPQMLRPLIDRLIEVRGMPAPRRDYLIAWEGLLGLSEEQQAAITKDVATAVNQFAQADATGFNPLKRETFITEYLGLPAEAMNEEEDMEPGEDLMPPAEEADKDEDEAEETQDEGEEEA